jgi:SIR2-like domain
MAKDTRDLWSTLLQRIHSDRCMPFLGAGAAADILPTGQQIAEEWANEYDYPYPDKSNLGAVAQFVADKSFDNTAPKRLIARRIASEQSRDSIGAYEPYDTLANLPVSVYVTTNYDDLMARALIRAGRSPRVEVCMWNRSVRETQQSVFDTDYEPRPDEPLVYHLHGHINILDSLVLTDDDYLDFLLTAFSDRTLIPPFVQGALAGRSLLFIGYRLYDWNFRALFRRFSAVALQRVNFAVLLQPRVESGNSKKEFRQRIDYFARLGIQPYFGSAKQFAEELRPGDRANPSAGRTLLVGRSCRKAGAENGAGNRVSGRDLSRRPCHRPRAKHPKHPKQGCFYRRFWPPCRANLPKRHPKHLLGHPKHPKHWPLENRGLFRLFRLFRFYRKRGEEADIVSRRQ